MQKFVVLMLSLAMVASSCKENKAKKLSDKEVIQRHKIITDSLSKVAQAKEKKYTDSELSEITFEDTQFDFGTIQKSAGKVSHYYTFTNTGKKPLMIEVNPGCGCTVGDYPKDPIAPGAQDSIKLEFNPSAFGGKQVNKSATVKGNIKENVTLRFSADVSES